jgi:hypothetical protein
MHINFNPERVNWKEILQSMQLEERMLPMQAGGGGYNIFQGTQYQRGAGIGALFKSLLRFLIPITKNVGHAVGRQGLESGTKILSSVLEGKQFKEALKDEGRAGLQNLLQKASAGLEGGQEGMGRRKRKSSKKTVKKSGRKGTKAKKKKGKRHINKRKVRKLFSQIEPPLFPNPFNKNRLKRKSSLSHKFKKLPKKVHFDELGPY